MLVDLFTVVDGIIFKTALLIEPITVVCLVDRVDSQVLTHVHVLPLCTERVFWFRRAILPETIAACVVLIELEVHHMLVLIVFIPAKCE